MELDVRATADRALAVRHDRHIPGGFDVENIWASELPPGVPLLDEALDACAGLRVNVEIKGGPNEAALVARLLRRRGPGSGAPPAGVFVSSFDVGSVAAFRDLAPSVAAGLLVDWRTDAGPALDAAVRLGCATLHPFVTQVDARLVDAARGAGLGLHVWTVNADADLVRMGELGVDAVITDRVAAAVRILRRGTPGAAPA